jgi:hypothetical protein
MSAEGEMEMMPKRQTDLLFDRFEFPLEWLTHGHEHFFDGLMKKEMLTRGSTSPNLYLKVEHRLRFHCAQRSFD